MPFQLRVTETPPLARLTEVSQIVIVDRTGPVIPLGVSPGAVCLVAEFLKGPFTPKEATSTGELFSIWGRVSNLLSQSVSSADLIQDGGGGRYEGNGALALLGKTFRRLILQRVDTDMVSADGGTTKTFLRITATIPTADADPNDATVTGKDITIPAGTRFANVATAVADATGKIVALSQDVLIPKGTKITTGTIVISSVAALSPNVFNCSQDSGTGMLTVLKDSAGNASLLVANSTGPTAFFVKGTSATTAGADLIDTVLDAALPDITSTITAVNTANAAGTLGVDVFAAGTAVFPLMKKIDSLYAAAIDKTRPTGSPQEDIGVIWAARRGFDATTVRTPLTNNAVNASEEGRGRIAIVAGPRVGAATATNGYGDVATVATAKTDAQTVTPPESPGRSDRKLVTFPYIQIFSSDLGKTIEVAPDSFMAATLSNFVEEKNPGAKNDFIQSILDLQPQFISSPMAKQDYINFRSKGVAALRKDRAVGWWFQDGVTSVDPAVFPTRAPIKRRRMADFIQDTLAGIGARFNKEPATTERIDSLVGEMESFLTSLKSPPNPSLMRIEDFSIDATTGNTPSLTALGIFTFIIKVRCLASMDTLVFETSIGETVTVTQVT